MTGRILPDLRQARPMLVEPLRRGPKRKLPEADLRREFESGKEDAEIAAAYHCSVIYVKVLRSKLGLLRQRGRKSDLSPARLTPKEKFSTRHAPKIVAKAATMPAVSNAALSEGRTIYPSTVVDPRVSERLLVSGVNHWKLGSQVSKGPWRGFPIYVLTLEERATCPDYCRHWRSCMGNHMHRARRHEHGAALEARLAIELIFKQQEHPNGFAVRLHALGDFYSVEYVKLWERWLDEMPALHVFGFTARYERQDPIARALVELTLKRWPRFAMRFSNAPVDECSTVSIEHPRQCPDDAVICPQQTGHTSNCGSCALCWHSKRRIAFLQH